VKGREGRVSHTVVIGTLRMKKRRWLWEGCFQPGRRLFWLTFILGQSVGEPPKTMRTIMAFPVGLGDTRFDSAAWLLIPHISNSQQKVENLSS